MATGILDFKQFASLIEFAKGVSLLKSFKWSLFGKKKISFLVIPEKNGEDQIIEGFNSHPLSNFVVLVRGADLLRMFLPADALKSLHDIENRTDEPYRSIFIDSYLTVIRKYLDIVKIDGKRLLIIVNRGDIPHLLGIRKSITLLPSHKLWMNEFETQIEAANEKLEVNHKRATILELGPGAYKFFDSLERAYTLIRLFYGISEKKL
jgi:hypothetical protein